MVEIYVFEGFWSVKDIQKNKEYLWLYGDNDIKRGKGGQAIIRDEINTYGIPTKKFPNNNLTSYYTDDEYDNNCEKIITAFNKVRELLKEKNYKGIVFPKMGFGTGLAQLNTKAPKTFEFLNNYIELFKKEIDV